MFRPPAEPLWLGLHWAVLAVDPPHPGARHDLELAPHRDVADLLDLSAPARAEFWVALQWVHQCFGLTFYGLAVHCGDHRFNGSERPGLRVRVLVGGGDAPGYEPIRVPFSSRGAV